MLQRAYSSCGFSMSLHSRNSVVKHGRSSHHRWLATHTTAGCASHDLSWEDEAVQDMMLSLQRRQAFPVPSKGNDISIQGESLRAASPLRSSSPDHPTPRFDWRRRAPSRAPSQGNIHKLSRDGEDVQAHIKRLIPQHLGIQPGERFYHEVKAYENRWVLLPASVVATELFLLDFYPYWSSSKSKRRRNFAKDWQSGPSRNCATRVIASPGCRHFG